MSLSIHPTKEGIQEAPQTIGVYIFCGKGREEYLYIGKSINLKARLNSHWESTRMDERERAIFEGTQKIKLIPVESEFKALLYEAQLIQKHQPRYNRIWKDDKSHLYIKINLKDRYPKVLLVRKENDGKSSYFGPFSSVRVAERLLKEIRKVIPFCMQRNIFTVNPCFYGKMGLCDPCPNTIEAMPEGPEKEEVAKYYKKNIRQLVRIFKGDTSPVLKGLYAQLKELTKNQEYEDALILRNRILSFERLITERVGLEKEMLFNATPGDAAADLRQVLSRHFPGLPELHRIECYDISNLSFKQATASMVVATDGLIDKSQYRKFRIKNPSANSDFEMLTETFLRRFRNNWPPPDLLVVDGGKPQVRTILKVLEIIGKDIPLIGIAKNPDRLVIGRGELPTIRLALRHPGFNLVRLLRDESHRFSKKYHVLLRSREFLP